MVCFRYIIVNTGHKGDDNDNNNNDDDDDNDNNNNNLLSLQNTLSEKCLLTTASLQLYPVYSHPRLTASRGMLNVEFYLSRNCSKFN